MEKCGWGLTQKAGHVNNRINNLAFSTRTQLHDDQLNIHR